MHDALVVTLERALNLGRIAARVALEVLAYTSSSIGDVDQMVGGLVVPSEFPVLSAGDAAKVTAEPLGLIHLDMRAPLGLTNLGTVGIDILLDALSQSIRVSCSVLAGILPLDSKPGIIPGLDVVKAAGSFSRVAYANPARKGVCQR